MVTAKLLKSLAIVPKNLSVCVRAHAKSQTENAKIVTTKKVIARISNEINIK